MRPKGTSGELRVRREIAGRLLVQGRKLREVAEACDVNISSVKRWKEALRKGGWKALTSERSSSRPAKLDASQEARLKDVLLNGPIHAGYPNDLWTCGRVAEVIEKQFGIHYHLGHVWKILRRLNFSCQVPEQKPREQCAAEVYRWRRYQWPALKKLLGNIAGRWLFSTNLA